MHHMKRFLICALAMAAFSTAATAATGDLWEFTSSSSDPDGKAIPHAERKCLPVDGVDPSKLLENMGSCTYDHKSGHVSDLKFAMTCRAPGVPASLGAMKVVGDAKLNGARFDMRYTITVGGDSSQPGDDFKMTGNLEGRKVGSCNL